MRKLVVIIMALFSLVGFDCRANDRGFEIISQETAYDIMSHQEKLIVVDVREPYEYATGHIANAILVPLSILEKVAAEKLPDKKQLLLVYCRSGRRSKIAAEKLAKMGYINIKEFGGIMDWKYGITN